MLGKERKAFLNPGKTLTFWERINRQRTVGNIENYSYMDFYISRLAVLFVQDPYALYA